MATAPGLLLLPLLLLLLLLLLTAADDIPGPEATEATEASSAVPAAAADAWRCPAAGAPELTCACDLPHTLRCAWAGAAGAQAGAGAESEALRRLGARLRLLGGGARVSLLDCSLAGARALGDDGPLLAGAALDGLVVSSGELRRLGPRALAGLAAPLRALGLPNNALEAVPARALRPLRTALQRLDLSRNRLRALDNSSLEGLANLTFLDLSDNRLSELAPGALAELGALETLRLRGNRLELPALAALRGLRALRDLDLSDNRLAGPLGPAALPQLPGLRALQLAGNQLASVRRSALRGAAAYGLRALGLARNHIDVLEDDAFRHLANLAALDLAHNRIVAVAGASLAHLGLLERLDLAHNFLRALAADLTAPLAALRELRLDDNDIALVASDALPAGLRRLTLADNPLSCDCNMAPFAAWLAGGGAAALPEADRASAVCATPPSLENALLVRVPAAELACGDGGPAGALGAEGEPAPEPAPPPGPLSARAPTPPDALATLRALHYDGARVSLAWSVAAAAAPYACSSLLVYERAGEHEVLAESARLQCDSARAADPTALAVSLDGGELRPGRDYRYCLLLLRAALGSDELAMHWACSGVLRLGPAPALGPGLVGLSANATRPGSLEVRVQLRPPPAPACALTLAVYAAGALAVKRRLNCSDGNSEARARLQGLPPGPYRVCAALGDAPAPLDLCVPVAGAGAAAGPAEAPAPAPGAAAAALAAAVAAALAAAAALLGLYLAAGRLLQRPACRPGCGSPALQQPQGHSRYVKLQATTRL